MFREYSYLPASRPESKEFRCVVFWASGHEWPRGISAGGDRRFHHPV